MAGARRHRAGRMSWRCAVRRPPGCPRKTSAIPTARSPMNGQDSCRRREVPRGERPPYLERRWTEASAMCRTLQLTDGIELERLQLKRSLAEMIEPVQRPQRAGRLIESSTARRTIVNSLIRCTSRYLRRRCRCGRKEEEPKGASAQKPYPPCHISFLFYV